MSDIICRTCNPGTKALATCGTCPTCHPTPEQVVDALRAQLASAREANKATLDRLEARDADARAAIEARDVAWARVDEAKAERDAALAAVPAGLLAKVKAERDEARTEVETLASIAATVAQLRGENARLTSENVKLSVRLACEPQGPSWASYDEVLAQRRSALDEAARLRALLGEARRTVGGALCSCFGTLGHAKSCLLARIDAEVSEPATPR